MTTNLVEWLKATLAKYSELAGAWALIVMLVVGGVGIGSFMTSYNDRSAMTVKDAQHTAEVNRLQATLMVVLPKLMDKASTAVDSASSAATMATQAANDTATASVVASANAAVSKKRSENNMQEIRNSLAKTQSDIGKNNVPAKVMPESSRSKLNKLVEKSNSQLNR